MLLVAVSCGSSHHTRPDRTIRAQFRTIQPLLLKSEKVDSCLAVLQAMDTAALKRPADKARWSLLYAMALDKNYIDTTDLSVISPAMECYTPWHHLNRKDKFYTWYYKARIEENARVYDASLNSYLYAERYMGATDDVYRTRLYFGFERVYMRTMAFKDAYESARHALFYAKKTHSNYNLATSLLDCAIHAASSNDSDAADDYLREYDSQLGSDYPRTKGEYYRAKMIVYQYRVIDYPDSSMYYLSLYEQSGVAINLLQCALACIRSDKYEEAAHYIRMHELKEVNNRGKYDYVFYYCRSKVREYYGDYIGALNDLREQEWAIDRGYMYSIDEEIPYTADKFHHELKRWKTALLVLFLASLIIIVSLVMFFVLAKRKHQLMLIERSYNDIRQEYDDYKQTIRCFAVNGNRRTDNIDKVNARIIKMASMASGSDNMELYPAAEWLRKRSEANEMESMISMLGLLYCPSFFGRLQESCLNVFEIAYCIMSYSLSTKELSFVFNRKDLYNINMSIKKKLGLKEYKDMRHAIKYYYQKSAVY